MIWSVLFLLILLAGGLGSIRIFQGANRWIKKGERAQGIAHIIGGVVLATPLGLLLSLFAYLTVFPISWG